jgi:hypothetical protein
MKFLPAFRQRVASQRALRHAHRDAGAERSWMAACDPDIGRGRRRPLNPTKPEVEITSEAIDADAIFSLSLRQ